MDRTIYAGHDGRINLEALNNVEYYLTKEEILEMNTKIISFMHNLPYKFDAPMSALTEQTFKRGYLAAHIRLPDGQ